MDPNVVWPVVGLIATGGGIAALAGLVGALFQDRREHQRWLRNERLEAYSSLLAETERFHTDPLRLGPENKQRTLDALLLHVARMQLLGPQVVEKSVDNMTAALMNAFLHPDDPIATSAYRELRNAYIAEARRALRVNR
jgi:hypothetical protein